MFRFLPFIFCVFAFVACTPAAKQEPEKTQLEIREIQTRTFDTTDFKLVMKSVLNTLQDDNYIVKNVAMDLGFLTAIKEKDVEDSNSKFWAKFQRSETARWLKHSACEATINVSEFGNQIRVRATFQTKVMDNKGAVATIFQVTDEEFYQDFFSKVGKGIFIQQQHI